MARSQSPQSKRSHSPQRIGHLSVLPVFFNLRGKPALIIGGGEPAAWKAELLAQAGASVRVVAEAFCKEMHDLANRTDLQGKVELHDRHFVDADFIGVALVVADAENDAEAALIVQTAARSGVPCNVIDRAEFCTFQFGSIVNRSPVVIGISTDGAAPVLGQTIRTKIESLLPDSLSQWATYAKEIRSLVLHRFSPGSDRRHFWTNFSKLAFGPFRPECVWGSCQTSGEGRVSFAEVHPFDPDELTLRSIRTLQTADVIYFDCRISPKVIDLARREAIRLEVKNWSGRNSDFRYKTEIADHVRSGRQVALVRSSLPDRKAIQPTLPKTTMIDSLSLTNSCM